MNKKHHANITSSMIICAVLTATLIVGMGVSNYASAKSATHLEATATDNSQGTLTCPNQDPLSAGIIQFSATVGKKPTGTDQLGLLQISSPSPYAPIYDYIYNGKISEKQYQLSGNEVSSICPSPYPTEPTTFTVSGKCGSDVTINFVAANGERIIFEHYNVVCS
jgi:hypothetical protein